MKHIATAFINAKKAFGPVLKTANNPHFKSKFAPLDACLEAVDNACLNAGIALYQETFEDATGVTVETVFLHESGEVLRCGKLHVPASKQDPQGYGSALTYARRYSLLTACGIAAEDDDGNHGSRPVEKPAQKFDVAKSVKILNTAANLESLTAFWKAEVSKFPADSSEYAELKKAAAARKQFLSEMGAGK